MPKHGQKQNRGTPRPTTPTNVARWIALASGGPKPRFRNFLPSPVGVPKNEFLERPRGSTP